MKKIIILLLALVAVFSLCTCGKKEHEKQEQVIAAMDDGVRVVTGSSEEELQEPIFDISKARLKKYAGRVYFDFLFECIYPENKHENNPTDFSVWYNLLDADGVIVDKNRFILKDLKYGDKGWSSAFYANESNKLFNPEDVATIEIVRYTAHLISESKLEEYHLSEPIVFQISDMDIVE